MLNDVCKATVSCAETRSFWRPAVQFLYTLIGKLRQHVKLAVFAAVAAYGGMAQAQSDPRMPSGRAVGAPVPAENAGVQVPAPAPSTNPVRQAAEQRGFASCGARVEQVTNFVGFGPAAGAFLMAPGGAGAAASADQRSLPLVMEIPLGPASALVMASFTPNQATGACAATYDAMVFWPQPCEVVIASQFGALRRLGLIKRDVLVLDGGPATKVFLMMAGAGCISVKKELVL